MITKKRYLKLLTEIEEITGLESAIYSVDGRLLAAIGDEIISREELLEFLEGMDLIRAFSGCSCRKILVGNEVRMILVMEGSGEKATVCLGLAAGQLQILLEGEAGKMDQGRFLSDLLNGEVRAGDILQMAGRLHIQERVRCLICVDTEGKDVEMVSELVRNMANVTGGDFVSNPEERYVVWIRDLTGVPVNRRDDTVRDDANMLADAIQTDIMIRVRIGVSSQVSRIREMTAAYREARTALEIGRIFYASRDVIYYRQLGLGRLIYQLPEDLCRIFLKEVFGEELPDIFEDEEDLSTVRIFFENDLNIAETARQLYIHRNTLVYRLEKIDRKIGLDIRKFEDAMTFHIASMVLAHLKAIEKKQKMADTAAGGVSKSLPEGSHAETGSGIFHAGSDDNKE